MAHVTRFDGQAHQICMHGCLIGKTHHIIFHYLQCHYVLIQVDLHNLHTLEWYALSSVLAHRQHNRNDNGVIHWKDGWCLMCLPLLFIRRVADTFIRQPLEYVWLYNSIEYDITGAQ